MTGRQQEHEAEGYETERQLLVPNLVPEGGPWEEEVCGGCGTVVGAKGRGRDRGSKTESMETWTNGEEGGRAGVEGGGERGWEGGEERGVLGPGGSGGERPGLTGQGGVKARRIDCVEHLFLHRVEARPLCVMDGGARPLNVCSVDAGPLEEERTVSSSADAVLRSSAAAAAGAAADGLAGMGGLQEENAFEAPPCPPAQGAGVNLRWPSPSVSTCFSSLLSAHLATPSAPNRLVLRSVCSHKPVLLLVLLSAHTAVGWGVCGHAEKGREEEEEEVLKGVDAGKHGEEEEWKETEGKEGGLRRVVKLMCKAVDSDSNATREADEWGARGHAEDVYVMPVTASELQGCLNENSRLLPPNCREFNGFTVSFLQV
ncbi:unnamed protein product [Closterium sp. NIES-54]